jgi:hypothetical protein
MDKSRFYELLENGRNKAKLSVIAHLFFKGAIGFPFSAKGVLVGLATKSVYSNQDLMKQLRLSTDSHVQQLGGNSRYLLWINRADYDSMKKSGLDLQAFFKERFQNENFSIESINENIEDKYTRQ